METFYTSDTHAFHRNICSGCTEWESGATRPFDCPEKMTEFLAARINSTAGRNDRIIHCGDVAFGGQENPARFREMINCGSIVLILGNHDKINRSYDRWIEKNHHLFEGIHRVWEGRFYGRKIFFSHYAHLVWEGSHRGTWHLFGHSHGSIAQEWDSNSLDCGVDTEILHPETGEILHEKYSLYTHGELERIFSLCSPAAVDHHQPGVR